MHTKEGSACASATGAEMVNAYIKLGYAGIIVTDHFFNGNTAISSHLTWESRVELFYRGYENATKEAEGTEFYVFFGWEYSYHGADFLTYGLDKKFLLEHPNMLAWTIEEYFDIVHQNGGFIIHAHPFREAPYIKAIQLFPDKVDAVEVINASHTNPEFSKKALQYAKMHSLLQTCGSDSHHISNLPEGGMEFDYEIHSIKEFIIAVRAGGLNYQMEG